MTTDLSRMLRLNRPDHPIDVVLDTDTYNEIDDQFALAYLIKNEEKLHLKAVYAAPFFNQNSTSPEDGMKKSYQEIFNVLTLLGREDLKNRVYKGSPCYLPDENTPVCSEMTSHLGELAMNYTPENPLYVVAIGAITNVASALLLHPEITDRIVIVWLGGHALEWKDNQEFNCMQDVAAARVVLGSGVAMVLLPCMGVVSAFATTRYELEHWLKGKNALCDYLCDVTIKHVEETQEGICWSKPIWDVTAVAWLLDEAFMEDRLEPAPIPEYDHHWAFDKNRPLIRYVTYIHRDRLFEDLFTKLANEGD